MKRSFDLSLSLIGLILLSPIFFIVSILIKIDSPGPVFFKQKRMGKKFKSFYIYKFRSMIQNAPGKGPEVTVGGDSRITRTGVFLRKLKIDELPQLINVLKGDMSLVGPRPEMQKYVEMYKNDYEEILSVRPGITDISSITFRDEESVLRSKDDPEWYYQNVLLPEKIKLAQEYIKNATFFYDLKMIFMTLYRLFNYEPPKSSKIIVEQSKNDNVGDNYHK